MYLNWEKQAQDYWVIDVETDGLTPTVVWCMGYENVKTREKGICRGHEEIRKFFEERVGSRFVGHNLLRYDAPVLNRIVGTRLPLSRLVDTLVLSTLYSPSLAGGHSLGAWGERIGFEKLVFDDWSKLSEEMVTYCIRDVEVCAELFRKLTRVLSKIGFSEKTCHIQHHITHIIEKQHKNGFYFDGERAVHFYQQLRRREEELEEAVRHVFPPERRMVRQREIYTKSGSPSAQYVKDREVFEIEESDEGRRYSAFERVPFNLGSPKQRAEKLLALGWVPDERTPRSVTHPNGQPKVTEKSLVKFAESSGIPEVALITKWMSVNGRANMVNTWLNEWNEDDGCIHGKLFVADTLRFRHQAPNTANIPAVRIGKDGLPLYGEAGYYTYESRDLWTARPNRVLVGTDAKGLELRMLAHYLDRAGFTKEVISGDPHQFNADTVGITRPAAKTLLYSIMYGAQGPKVAKTLGCSVQEGIKVRQEFLDRLGITGVMNDAIHEQKVGRVWLLDGAGVVCPSPHAALNYKLQGGGARVMALSSIFLDCHIRQAGLDSMKVGDIHDEVIYDCDPKDAEEHRRLSLLSLKEAGEDLNMNVPIEGTSLIGRSWAVVH